MFPEFPPEFLHNYEELRNYRITKKSTITVCNGEPAANYFGPILF